MLLKWIKKLLGRAVPVRVDTESEPGLLIEKTMSLEEPPAEGPSAAPQKHGERAGLSETFSEPGRSFGTPDEQHPEVLPR